MLAGLFSVVQWELPLGLPFFPEAIERITIMPVCFIILFEITCFHYSEFGAMSSSPPGYPNASMLKPHRCAFLMDDIIDAVHHWDKDHIKAAYTVWRACMKNEEINADMVQKPKYVNPREDYEGSSTGEL